MMEERLVARIRCGEHLLLQRQPLEATLDPGHWSLPGAPLGHATSKPHPALCAVPIPLASSLNQLLQTLDLPLRDLRSVTPHGVSQSPAWHPRPVRAHLLSCEIDGQITPAASHGNALRWWHRSDWQARFASGELLLNPHSQILLHSDMQADWATIKKEEPLPELQILPVRSHTLPPAAHTNAFLIGARDSLLVDPSPCDEAAYQGLLDLVRDAGLRAVLLTHHHPDHHQQSTRLARELELPILCSADSRARIPARFGADYWHGIDVHTVSDGDTVGRWLDQPVEAHAVPGHDEGQLALSPANRRWMIVGDLIQGIGTVVIGQPEGHMGRYFRSLQWVINQAPGVILPSHGQAMAGTHRIAETLRHRRQREEQVLRLARAGHDLESMLAQIYAQVDRRLWGLARMNIQAHLDKLLDEGRLPPN